MTTLKDVVNEYKNSVTKAITLRNSLPIGASFEQCVLHHKVRKHFDAGNYRNVAKYAATFYAEFEGLDVHEETIALFKAAGLKRNFRYGVGYLNSDGTYHWFNDKPVHKKVFNPKKFAVKKGSWQAPYRILFGDVKGRVNLQFGLSKRKVPFEARKPTNGDVLFERYKLMVSGTGNYLDVCIDGELEPITPAIGWEERTLMDCWRVALADYYMEHDAHWPNLHASWYEWVETY